MSMLSVYPSFVSLLALQPLLLDADGPRSFPFYAIPLMFVMMAGMGLMMWLMMRMMMGMGGHGSSDSSPPSHQDLSHENARDHELSDLRAEATRLREQVASLRNEAPEEGPNIPRSTDTDIP